MAQRGRARPLFGAGESVGKAKTFGGRKSHVGLVGEGSIRLMVPRGAKEKITARIVYRGPVPAPIRQGQLIGVLKVWRDDMLALEIPLQAAEDIDGGSLLQRAMDGVRELAIGLFRAAAQRL